MAENDSEESKSSDFSQIPSDAREKSESYPVIMMENVRSSKRAEEGSVVTRGRVEKASNSVVDDNRARPHVAKEENKQHTSPASVTKPSPLQTPPDGKGEPGISPDNPGKRRRVQHNYRRLSSSGYLDDYEGKERFSGTTEADMSVNMSPSSPKGKPFGGKQKGPTRSNSEPMLNGVQSGMLFTS